MKKVLLLPFLFLLFACARNSESSTSNNPTIVASVESPVYSEEPKINQPEIKKIKVYIENTLSMYGYLPYQGRGGVVTNFRSTINELLRTSKNAYHKENVKLFLINNTLSTPINIDDNLDKIDDKILGNKYSKGNGSSDFDKLFKDILKDWNEDEVVVFIADFIYSPKNRDPITGLDDYRGEIATAFQNAKKDESLAVNILHFESDFHGKYYDIEDKVHLGVDNRPYYVFIIGTEDNVKEYSQQVVPQLEKYNLKNNYNLSPSEVEIDDYSALPFTLNKGQFEVRTDPSGGGKAKAVTVKNSLNEGDRVQLALAVDLSDVPVSSEYLMDIENYQLNDEKIEIKNIGLVKNKKIRFEDGAEKFIKSNDLPKIGNTSVVFLISFPNTYKGSLELSLKKEIPDWVNEISIPDGQDDRDIETNILKQSQTFGFNYIVQGIYDAQRLKNPENKYFRIALDIDQKKSGPEIWGIIGWIIGLGIIGIIIFIVIRNKQRK